MRVWVTSSDVDMLNHAIRLHDKSGVDAALKVLIGLVLLGLLSPHEFGGDPVPITPQSLLVVLIPVVFGWKIGTTTVVLYLLAGGCGLPVFAEGTSGIDRFTGVTGGFLLAFPIAALIVGFASEQRFRFPALMALLYLLLGQFLILLLGLFWMEQITHEPLSFIAQLREFAPGLAVKAGLGTVIFVMLDRIFGSEKV